MVLDPITGMTAVVGAGTAITAIYEKIKKARAEGKIAKAEALMKELQALEAEIKAHADSDRKILKLIEEGKCDGIGNPKKFKELMNEVFRRNPEQQVILGKKYEKCIAIAKKSIA